MIFCLLIFIISKTNFFAFSASILLKPYESFAIKLWFSNYLNWITTHEYGIAERDNGNNHSVCWTMQVAAFADLIKDTKTMDFCRNFYKTTLLPNQMEKDGSFPLELKRTKPYGYSLFNLDAMTSICQILSTKNPQVPQKVTIVADFGIWGAPNSNHPHILAPSPTLQFRSADTDWEAAQVASFKVLAQQYLLK